MDPDANLQEQLSIAKGILADKENHTYGAVHLAELVEAMDYWIRHDGFAPQDWRRTL